MSFCTPKQWGWSGLRASGVKGSSRWRAGEALKAAGQGLLLGKLDGQLLRYDRPGHLLTVAATRSGKGVGSIIPNLLHFPGSLIVTDPKGENYYVTAQWRRETLGHEVVAMDPVGIAEKDPVGFNPLDLVGTNVTDYVETFVIQRHDVLAKSHGNSVGASSANAGDCTVYFSGTRNKRRMKGGSWIVNVLFYTSAGVELETHKKKWFRWRRVNVDWIEVDSEYLVVKTIYSVHGVQRDTTRGSYYKQKWWKRLIHS